MRVKLSNDKAINRRYLLILEKIINKYKKRPEVLAVCLFGSGSRGEIQKGSDLDIIVFTKLPFNSGEEYCLLDGIFVNIMFNSKYRFSEEVDSRITSGNLNNIFIALFNYRPVYDPAAYVRGIKKKIMKKVFGGRITPGRIKALLKNSDLGKLEWVGENIRKEYKDGNYDRAIQWCRFGAMMLIHFWANYSNNRVGGIATFISKIRQFKGIPGDFYDNYIDITDAKITRKELEEQILEARRLFSCLRYKYAEGIDRRPVERDCAE